AGSAPAKVLLVGTIPQRTTTGPGLTEPVRRAVSYAAFQVIREIERLGGTVTVHATPCPQPVWWEASPTPVRDDPVPPALSSEPAGPWLCDVRAPNGLTVRALTSLPRREG